MSDLIQYSVTRFFITGTTGISAVSDLPSPVETWKIKRHSTAMIAIYGGYYIIGALESLKNQGIPFLSNLHKNYGQAILVNNLGTLGIRTIDSENLQTAWSTNNSDWGYEPHRLLVMGPFCERGSITTDNWSWQKARVLLRPTFSKANISDLKPFINGTKKFFKGIPENVQAYLYSLINTEINAEESALNARESNSRSLLRGLVKETDDQIEIRDNALQGMIAVQDTTPVLLSIRCSFSRATRRYDRLRDEVQSLDLESSPHLYDRLRDIRFLRNIVNESLRLFPTFPILTRMSLKDTSLPKGGGKDGNSPIYIPKGTELWANFYGLHRSESVFSPDIESFNPDRWDSIKPSP
ncbi:e970f2af-79d4-4469-9ca5-699f99c48071 [Sclerotinia trifoliorum]|uniref:E970f2af-79d4-4469-9ca5-699f99c48071 n=1 Tax=Sclerotinia trifoliorum TaxID=28548 RepID=A0A8H2ZMI7_9HELO|nr:e970f2af-79d4-4469-9ca5-699f99c48071 [Sclerotinia trifoliorum]